MFAGYYICRELCSKGIIFAGNYVRRALYLQGIMFAGHYICRELCSQDLIFLGIIYFNGMWPVKTMQCPREKAVNRRLKDTSVTRLIREFGDICRACYFWNTRIFNEERRESSQIQSVTASRMLKAVTFVLSNETHSVHAPNVRRLHFWPRTSKKRTAVYVTTLYQPLTPLSITICYLYSTLYSPVL